MNTRMRSILLIAGGIVAGLLLSALVRSCGAETPELADAQSAPTQPTSQPHAEHVEHENASASASADAAPTTWVCPMHPQIRQNEPGTCPICFMDLVPQQAAPSDRADTLPVTPAAAALMEIRRSPVERVPLTQRIDATGRVAIADDGAHAITAWLAGRVERVYVRNTGDRVSRGERLVTIYSPELVQAQQTLRRAQVTLAEIDAARTQTASPGSANSPVLERASDTRRTTALSTIRAVREQLLLLGLSESQVDDIEHADGVERTITIRAPAAGTLLDAPIQPGQYVAAGTPLVNLADLDQVWIELDVFAGDAALVIPGQTVAVRVPGSDASVDATVDSIEPVSADSPNFMRVRAIAPNTAGSWRPGTRVRAELIAAWPDERPPASVPAQAVLWGGERSLVYVWDATVDPPVVMPIEVEAEFGWVGPDGEPRAVIHSGVFPGETVVANGTFRLDAELQLRGGPSLMNGASDSQTPPSADGSGGGGHVH
jgi:Cu(I)/Ag(I) efflux system membrane fusion protein